MLSNKKREKCALRKKTWKVTATAGNNNGISDGEQPWRGLNEEGNCKSTNETSENKKKEEKEEDTGGTHTSFAN